MRRIVLTNIDLKSLSPFPDTHPVECHTNLPEISPRGSIGSYAAGVDLHSTQAVRYLNIQPPVEDLTEE